MSKYTFTFTDPDGISNSVGVQFDDTNDPFIEGVLSAFEQFLLGVTFQPSTIKKYLDTDGVQDALVARARAVAEYKAKHGA